MNEMKGVKGGSHDGQKRMRVWIFYLGGLLLLLVLVALVLFFSGPIDQIGNLHCTTPLAASSSTSLELEGFVQSPR